ncbi:hypothetical protein [Parvularcula oceani]|uniref:hypothetical protein n=1 Tax=Parvularcula oceani TaxID=1247963 RepID=UPI0004E2064B|nr:hypothetical protein [Parvularcula oceani]
MPQNNFQHGRQFSTAHQIEIEQTLDGVYAWNAKTAKFGILWVCLTQGLRIGSAAGVIVSIFGAFVFAAAYSFDSEWFLWLAAAIPFALGYLFFSHIASAVLQSHRTALKLATEIASEQ